MIAKEYQNRTILIVENSAKVRNRLYSILNQHFRNVYYAQNGCEGMEKIKEHSPDIIISGINIPCQNGLEVLKSVRSPLYTPIVIFITKSKAKEHILEALNLRVHGYLLKPFAIEELIQCIRNALESTFKIEDKRYKKLSSREFDVFIRLAKGMKPAQIAQELDIKAKTISTYRERIFEKMSFRSNADMTIYAVKNGLI